MLRDNLLLRDKLVLRDNLVLRDKLVLTATEMTVFLHGSTKLFVSLRGQVFKHVPGVHGTGSESFQIVVLYV